MSEKACDEFIASISSSSFAYGSNKRSFEIIPIKTYLLQIIPFRSPSKFQSLISTLGNGETASTLENIVGESLAENGKNVVCVLFKKAHTPVHFQLTLFRFA